MKRLAHILFLALTLLCNIALSAAAQPIVYRPEQIDSLQRIEKRPVVVFIHTGWCRFCRAMENVTFKNTQVASALNSRFYFVSLNAEEKRSISFDGRIFQFKPSGANTGIHELAVELGGDKGAVSYPTISLLNSENKIIFRFNGFISVNDFLSVFGNGPNTP